MDWFWVLIIGAGILSVLGPLFWVIVAIVIGRKAANSANMALGYGTSELDQLLIQLDQLVRAANANAAGMPSGQQLSPQQQLQFQQMLMQAQNQMAQLDNLSQQRYETRISGLTGYAAANGLDWTPDSF
jgi:uncharacterized membrane protein